MARLYLVDGTYELFRAHFAMPAMSGKDGQPVGAVRGLTQSLLSLLRQPEVTHIAVAFDHVIESFRNRLFPGYKDGSGVPEDLLSQFGLAEKAVSSVGVTVWPMIEYEADDALATAASAWGSDARLEQVVVCSPDKDLAQTVVANRVVCLDRRREIYLDEAGVYEKFGVGPTSIPDYLALVGDSADGIPGIPRWGAKSTAQVLGVYPHLQDIPPDSEQWTATPRGARAMALALSERMDDAHLYRDLATLRTDVPLVQTLEDLEWKGVPSGLFEAMCVELDAPRMLRLPHRWSDG